MMTPIHHRFAALICLSALLLTGCQALKSGSAKDGGEPAALEQRADAALANGRPDMAIAMYDQALRAGLDKGRGLLKQGKALLAASQWDQALAVLVQAQAAAPQNPEAPLLAGYAAERAGRPAYAEKLLRQALALRQDSALAHSLLGVTLNRLGKPEAALEEFDRALAISGPDAATLNNQGLTLYMLGRYANAEDVFRKAVALDPQARYRNNHALALCRLKRFNDAFDQFRAADGATAAHNNLGCCYLDENMLPQAQAEFEKAIASSPKFYKPAHDNLVRMGKTPPPPPSQDAPQQPANKAVVRENTLNDELAAAQARRPQEAAPSAAPAPLPPTQAQTAPPGQPLPPVLSTQSVKPVVQSVSPVAPAPQQTPQPQTTPQTAALSTQQPFATQSVKPVVQQATPATPAPSQQAAPQPQAAASSKPDQAKTITNITGVDSGAEYRLLISGSPVTELLAATAKQEDGGAVVTIPGRWSVQGQVVNYGLGSLVERVATEDGPQGLRIKMTYRKDAPKPATSPAVEPLPQGLAVVIKK